MTPTPQDKIEELMKEIKKFKQACKDWNNKKLDENTRRKAEEYVDKMTDKDRFPAVLQAELKGHLDERNHLREKIEKVIDNCDFVHYCEKGVGCANEIKSKVLALLQEKEK